MAANVTPLRKPGPRALEQHVSAPRVSGPPVSEPLWREVLGQRLRELRRERQEKLTETAGRAGISPQYLSEVERGRKEPSSEMIAALAGAFGLTLIDLTRLITEDLRREGDRGQHGRRASGPVSLLAMAA
jgi:DNA-binding XRE family transcriptional regulator